MTRGNFEDKNPDTGKAPKHQAAARKAFANSVSNAEVKPQTDSMHDFTAEEVIEIQRSTDAKMKDDEPYDEMRGKIYYFDDGSEWLIFQDSEYAERQAVEYVKSQLDYEPEMFIQEWLKDYIYMTDTDRRMFANEESTSYSDELSDEDALKEADLDDKNDELQEEIDVLESEVEDLENEKSELESTVEDEGDEEGTLTDQISDIEIDISTKMDEVNTKEKEQGALPDEARSAIQEGRYDEIYDELEDPVQYFVEDQGMYSIEELMESSSVSIDTESASQAAVDEDGVANFLAGYDGNEVELDNGMMMYRTD